MRSTSPVVLTRKAPSGSCVWRMKSRQWRIASSDAASGAALAAHVSKARANTNFGKPHTVFF
ncbi:MAG: hypothetical protein NTY53_08405 [Kiritimatiellaeota bacterium]|nr:hypothetical protein [Kiritimatiellota bacterium]